MKRLMFVVCLLAFAVASDAFAQQSYEDVVYLKDGSIIRGFIVEQIPNESLKMRLQGGSIMVFKMSNVLKITKELPLTPMTEQRIKNPGLALLLSFLISGAGQAYNEQYEKAVVHFLAAILTFTIAVNETDTDTSNFVMLLWLGNWGYAMYDAHDSAKKINERNRQNQGVGLIRDRLILEPYASREAKGAMLSLRF